MTLSTYLRSRFPDGVSVAEAEQLSFLIFCTVSWLPTPLRDVEWTRSAICSEFERMAREGFVVGVPSESGGCDAALWSRAIDQFLLHPERIDESFREKMLAR